MSTSTSSRTVAATGGSTPHGCTNFKLRQISRQITRHYDAMVKGSGLKTTQYTLLSHVTKLGPLRPSDLAAHMKLDASSLTRNLQPLIAQGWVEQGAGDDARSRMVRITESGRAKRAEAQRLWKQAQVALNDKLGEQRVAQLHALIDDCLALMDAPDEGETDE